MPIYQEKLICPLAIRFTQEHIRPVFQDGHDLEETVKSIRTKPGSGHYDVILEAPFPVIEIMRWRPRSTDSSESDGRHWFTLDNRRLYCLQRAAVALLPLRAAVAADAFQAAPEGALRKSDSSTSGCSVGIGHSLKMIVDRWDWHEQTHGNVDAHEHVMHDDEKATVADLLDAPAPPSMLERFMQQSSAITAASLPSKTCDATSQNSTLDASTPRSSHANSDHSSLSCVSPQATGKSKPADTTEKDAFYMMAASLSGKWLDSKGETYEVKVSKKDSWTCTRYFKNGNTKKDILWYDAQSDSICFGNGWKSWAYASEVRGWHGQVYWYCVNSCGAIKPSSTWNKLPEINTSTCHLSNAD